MANSNIETLNRMNGMTNRNRIYNIYNIRFDDLTAIHKVCTHFIHDDQSINQSIEMLLFINGFFVIWFSGVRFGNYIVAIILFSIKEKKL